MNTLENPEIARAVTSDFQNYLRLKHQLRLEHKPTGDEAFFISPQLVIEMAREAKIASPTVFSSHRHFIAKIKALIFRIFRPFVKVVFVHQQNFNDLTVMLAHSVISLEAKVKELEAKIIHQK